MIDLTNAKYDNPEASRISRVSEDARKTFFDSYDQLGYWLYQSGLSSKVLRTKINDIIVKSTTYKEDIIKKERALFNKAMNKEKQFKDNLSHKFSGVQGLSFYLGCKDDDDYKRKKEEVEQKAFDKTAKMWISTYKKEIAMYETATRKIKSYQATVEKIRVTDIPYSERENARFLKEETKRENK